MCIGVTLLPTFSTQCHVHLYFSTFGGKALHISTNMIEKQSNASWLTRIFVFSEIAGATLHLFSKEQCNCKANG